MASIKDYWAKVSDSELGMFLSPYLTDFRDHFGKIVTEKDFEKLKQDAYGTTPEKEADIWDINYTARRVTAFPNSIVAYVNSDDLEIMRNEIAKILRNKRP